MWSIAFNFQCTWCKQWANLEQTQFECAIRHSVDLFLNCGCQFLIFCCNSFNYANNFSLSSIHVAMSDKQRTLFLSRTRKLVLIKHGLELDDDDDDDTHTLMHSISFNECQLMIKIIKYEKLTSFVYSRCTHPLTATAITMKNAYK